MALTEKRKRFAEEYLIDLNATQAAIRAFGSLRGFKNTNIVSDPVGMVVNCICVLDDVNAAAYRKMACLLILKMLTTKELMKSILEDSGSYPFDRDDYRVRAWTKDVLSVGVCKGCGSTDNLCAHHVIGWAEYPQGRADRDNGECLCIHCHAEAHKGDKSYYLLKSQSDNIRSGVT